MNDPLAFLKVYQRRLSGGVSRQKRAMVALQNLLKEPMFRSVGGSAPGLQNNTDRLLVSSWRQAISWTKKRDASLGIARDVKNDLFARVREYKGVRWFDRNIHKLTVSVNEALPTRLRDVVSDECVEQIGEEQKIVFEKICSDLSGVAICEGYSDVLSRDYYGEVIRAQYEEGRFPCGWKRVTRSSSPADQIDTGCLVLF